MKAFTILALLIVASPFVAAAINFNQPLTTQEQQAFDKILEPIMKIYRFLKYIATAIGVVMLVIAGVQFTTAGGDTKGKENARNRAVGVIFGLVLIWVAPVIVQAIFS